MEFRDILFSWNGIAFPWESYTQHINFQTIREVLPEKGRSTWNSTAPDKTFRTLRSA